MDESQVEEALDRLVAAGLVEERDGELAPTRRWRARLQAAAEKLNLLAQKGREPDGNPLVNAVAQALAAENLGWSEAEFLRAVDVLVMLELTRMPPAKRAQLGFRDVALPGDEGREHAATMGFHEAPD